MSPPSPHLMRLLDDIRALVARSPLDEARSIALLRDIARTGEPAAIPVLLLIVPQKGSFLDRIAEAVGGRPRGLDGLVIEVIDELARKASMEDLLEIEQWMRSSLTPYRSPPIPTGSLLDRLGTMTRPLGLLGLASFHSNGHVRERAVIALGKSKDPASLPFLMLRVNDWVHQVHDASVRALSPWLGSERASDLVAMLLYVARLRGQARWDHGPLIATIEEVLRAPAARSSLLEGLRHPSREVRHEVYRLSWRIPALSKGELVRSGLDDPDLAVRIWAARHVDAVADDEVRWQLLTRMLDDPHPAVRGRAVEYMGRHLDKRGEGALRSVVLDPSGAVRQAARYYLGTLPEVPEFAAMARTVVRSSGGSQLRGAIAALGETGTLDDVPALEHLLRSQPARAATAALCAIASLMGDDARELVLSCLDDPRRRLVRMAITLSRSQLFDSDGPFLAALARAAPHAHSRHAAIELVGHLDRWRALSLYLGGLDDMDEGVRAHAREEIDVWLDRYDTDQYEPIPPSVTMLHALRAGLETHGHAIPLPLQKRLAAILGTNGAP